MAVLIAWKHHFDVSFVFNSKNDRIFLDKIFQSELPTAAFLDYGSNRIKIFVDEVEQSLF